MTTMQNIKNLFQNVLKYNDNSEESFSKRKQIMEEAEKLKKDLSNKKQKMEEKKDLTKFDKVFDYNDIVKFKLNEMDAKFVVRGYTNDGRVILHDYNEDDYDLYNVLPTRLDNFYIKVIH